jgi:hypothetical protein
MGPRNNSRKIPSSSVSGDEENGEWHFRQWGNVGVFCMDVKERALKIWPK